MSPFAYAAIRPICRMVYSVTSEIALFLCFLFAAVKSSTIIWRSATTRTTSPSSSPVEILEYEVQKIRNRDENQKRNKDETIISVIERLFVEHVTSRSVKTQNRELSFRCIAYNNMHRLTNLVIIVMVSTWSTRYYPEQVLFHV